MIALILSLAWLSCAWLVGVALFVDGGLLRCCPGLVVGMLARPFAAMVNCAVLGWLYFGRRIRGRPGQWGLVALAAVTLLVVDSGLAESSGPVAGASITRSLRLPLLLPIVLTAVLYGAVRLCGPQRVHLRELARELGWRALADAGAARRAVTIAFPCAGVALLATFAVMPPVGPRVNGHGLICFPPSTTIVEDYTGNTRVDDYPKVTNRYNSLGYRDDEPAPRDPAKRRVLVVGDSYVWGHGIPTNEETLPAQLRLTLEAAHPGRFDVVGAAFPANGVYGYSRAVRALADPLGARIAVVGYVGDNDHDPLDAQSIMDRTPTGGPLRRLVTSLEVRQYVHASARRAFGRPSDETAARLRDMAQQQVDELARFTSRRAIRLIFVHYFREPREPSVLHWPPGIEAVRLPEELRYQGHRDRYWYAKDVHPRPELNRRVAEMLAASIAAPPASAATPAATPRAPEP